MKVNEYLEQNQECDTAKGKFYNGLARVSACASPNPPLVGGDRHDSLLYHSENNSDKNYLKNLKKPEKKGKKSPYKPTSLQSKTFHSLDANCKHWMKIYGKEYIGVLTLTFKENLKCMKEAQRRYNNLMRMVAREGKFEILVKIAEAQKRGAVHYHILVKTNAPIRGNICWDTYEAMGKATDRKAKTLLGKELAKTAEPELVELWGWLRKKCKATKFGRHELMPMKKPDHVKNYIGKYLEKDMQESTLKQDGKNKGFRVITYGKKAPKVASTKFSWIAGKGGLYRYKLKKWADARGIKDADEMREIYGKAWSWKIYPHVMEDRPISDYLDKQHAVLTDPENERMDKVYPWKGQVISGAFSHKTKENIIREYLTDEELKRTNYQKHKKHFETHQRAVKAKALHEKIYG